MDFWANYPKICGNCPFMENAPTRKLGRKAYILHSEKCKQLINKIYSFNNIAMLSKACRFTISFALCTLFQKLVQKVAKKRTWNIIPLNDWLTGHPENFKIKLYYFQERLSLQYNIILKLRSLFHICLYICTYIQCIYM